MRLRHALAAVLLAVSTLPFTPAAAPAYAAAAPLRILPLGASLTYGFGSTDGNGYRELLRRHLVDEAGLPIDYVGSLQSGNSTDRDNEGHSGYRIDQVAGGVDGWIAAARPDVVLLNAGTNDMGQNYQLPTAPDRLSALVDQILRDAPNVVVVMSTLVPSRASNANVQAFNARVPAITQAKSAAGKRVYLADLNSALSLADIGPDGIHPTDAGYAKIADRWYATLQPALSLGTAGTLPGQESGRCADVAGYTQTSGTAVALWDCTGGTNQSWRSTPSKQLAVYGRKCLDANGGGVADGTKVQIWDCTGGTNQQWTVNADGTVVGVASGKCLDATGHGTVNGVALELWTCNGGANQKWLRS